MLISKGAISKQAPTTVKCEEKYVCIYGNVLVWENYNYFIEKCKRLYCMCIFSTTDTVSWLMMQSTKSWHMHPNGRPVKKTNKESILNTDWTYNRRAMQKRSLLITMPKTCTEFEIHILWELLKY